MGRSSRELWTFSKRWRLGGFYSITSKLSDHPRPPSPQPFDHAGLLAEDLLYPRDRLGDRLLGADAVGGDAMDRLGPDLLLIDQLVPPVARDLGVGVLASQRPRVDLHDRRHLMGIARVEPERL